MTHDIDHELAREGGDDGHLGPLRLDALRLGRGTEFEYGHLRNCESCRAGLALQRRLARELAPAAEAPFAIPDERRHEILARAQRALAPPTRGSIRSSARRAWLPLALAATLLIGVAAGRWVLPTPLSEPGTVVSSVRDDAGIAGSTDTNQNGVDRPLARTGLSGPPTSAGPTSKNRRPADVTRDPRASTPRAGGTEAHRDAPEVDVVRVAPTTRSDAAPGPDSVVVPSPAGPKSAPSATAPDTVTVNLAADFPDSAQGAAALRKAADAVETASHGRIRLKIHSGWQRDDREFVRLLRRGQVHAAYLSGAGLAELEPSIRVLAVPYFFSTPSEVERACQGVRNHLAHALSDKGFVLVGFGDVGFTYLYSTREIVDLRDLRRSKLRLAEGDLTTAAFAGEVRMKAVRLGTGDVASYLGNGLIDTVHATPSELLDRGWFRELRNLQPVPFTAELGGVVVSKAVLQGLGDEAKNTLSTALNRSWLVVSKSRLAESKEASARLADLGVSSLPTPSDEVRQRLAEISDQVADAEADRSYPRELLERVRSLRDEARARPLEP